MNPSSRPGRIVPVSPQPQQQEDRDDCSIVEPMEVVIEERKKMLQRIVRNYENASNRLFSNNQERQKSQDPFENIETDLPKIKSPREVRGARRETAAETINLTLGSSSDEEEKEEKKAEDSVSVSAEVFQILIYSAGRGGIALNTEDYRCLAAGEYLNDVIIDFYLNYLRDNFFTEEQKQKTHIFGSFFYNRLTSMTPQEKQLEKDLQMSSPEKAQNRHSRVKEWTKNVNIFEKDHIVIPINEKYHWFLVIICFPGLKGPQIFEEHCQEGFVDLTLNHHQPIKQPCMLIFNSLSERSESYRSRVVSTLKDYLTCEYRAKISDPPDYTFDKNTMPSCNVKVPQQSNLTDCGLFLLQYVEKFFLDPLKDYHLPIKNLANWFSTIEATRKREDIANLVASLMRDQHPDLLSLLPKLRFPTKNGELRRRNNDWTETVDEVYEESEQEEQLDDPRDPTFVIQRKKRNK